MKTASFCTLGCKVNQYETEALSELFADNGYEIVPFSERADIYVINTCSVTSVSDRKSRQMIRRAKKTNPDALIAVMGCYSQTAPEEVLDIDGVNLVLGTRDRHSVLSLLEAMEPGGKLNAVRSVSDNHEFEELKVRRCADRTRAYIKIQDGCSQFCSYCIIPYARGPVRSRPEAEILDEVRALAENGYKEIILTGIHAAAYGTDLENASLRTLLNKIDRAKGIRRVRLSSIEPMTLDGEFVAGIADCEKLCPHFHISLQSGSDSVLRRMNRRYTTDDFRGIVQGLRAAFPGCAVTTDIMAGFAGETDEEHRETLEFCREIGFADAHVFRYSRRRGTPAARRPEQCPPEVKEARAREIAAVARMSRDEFLRRHIGKTAEVLFETRTGGGLFEGKTANYITVHVPSERDMGGEFHNVLLEKAENGIIFGKTVD